MAKSRIRKYFTLAVGAIGFAGISSVEAQTKPLAMERVETINGKQVRLTSKLTKVKRVLVPQFWYNYDHNLGRAEVQRLLALIGTEDGITFEHFNKGQEAQFTVEKMKTTTAAVIIGNNITSINNSTLTTEQKNAVQNFVEVQGGGFMIIHGTGDSPSAGSWAWMREKAHPAGYLGHGTIGQTTQVWQPTSNTSLTPLPETATPHPIYEGIPRAKTTVREEFHNFTNIINDVVPAARILLHVDDDYAGFNCSCTKRPTRGHPISWTFPLAKGTIIYHAFGHDDKLATDSWGANQTRNANNWKTFLRQAMYFAAGYDTTEIPTGLRGRDSDYRFVDGGIALNEKISSVIFTENGPHSLQLMDVHGRVVASEKGSGRKEYFFGNRRISRGVYYLRAVSGKNVVTKRYFIGT